MCLNHSNSTHLSDIKLLFLNCCKKEKLHKLFKRTLTNKLEVGRSIHYFFSTKTHIGEKINMQIGKNKTAAIMIATLLIISMGASLILLPNASAHTPAWQIPTYVYINVSPNPIGVGQTVNVNFWVNAPPPTASAQYGDRWSNLSVIVTHPDGTTEKLGPFASDDTGGAHTSYTPTVVGNYTFQSFFGAEVVKGLNQPAGSPPISTNAAVNDTFLASTSTKFTLTVQQTAIAYASVAPLPTNYWTRPIYGENNNWYSIAGNWLGLAASTFAGTGMYNASANYNPYTTAPNSAHLLWTKPVAFGGIIGGEFGGSETGNYYSTSQYEPKFAPIIMQGILYYSLYPGASTYPQGWQAVDLHTGQVLWTKNINTEVLKCGQILQMITPNQYGALAYLWTIPVAAAGYQAAGQYMSMYDAMTGNYILTISGTPSMTLTTDDNGNLIGYYVNSSTTNAFPRTLNVWNSTRCINLVGANYGGGSAVADQWMWRPPYNTTIPFSLGIQMTTPIVSTLSGAPIALGLSALNSGVALMTQSSSAGSSYFQNGWIIEAGYSASTGALLWGPINRTEVQDSRVLFGSTTAGSGVWVEFDAAALTATGYSLYTGTLLWGPEALPNVNAFSSLGEQYCVANGVIYLWTYGGDVYAINLADGKFIWQYHTPSGGYESPYGVEPLWTFTVGTVADGKLFVPEGHMYSPPLFHNAQQLALNITNGQVVWSIDAFDVTSAPAISDGIMTTLNAYDNQLYTWGKGPTDMTVTAPDTVTTTGAPVVIRGTITDISAGAQQQAVAKNFPNGLPVVSDSSMTAWMEYVYMQQTRPSNATGVPISIDVVDSNGNLRNVGTTTSDTSGMFTFTWKPDITGDYTVMATFAGSESYYPTFAETSFTATSPAATPTATTAPLNLATTSDVMIYNVVGVIAIIIAIAIVGLLLFRKRA